MKNGKAPGLDNISTEMLKALGGFGIIKLTEIFNHIYDSGHLPEDLLQSVFITLPKKPRAVECGDFRTIETLSTRTVSQYAYVKIGKADQGNYKNKETSF
ncbi:endonuclease-reverse transcriptase [Elysia marginata]|uniref:Endonuclease-reverse transcriptase n=1 Tax=Elysia marginata TaxID=1093978 RepID=A0AAV4JWE8_9GAST|nr:endonuclease-reverse transcriptase [Elysia marginata]